MSFAASADERNELNRLFAELCAIESRSGHERRCAERVAAELSSLGYDVLEDDAGEASGSQCGNLFARVDARHRPSGQDRSGEHPDRSLTLLLCAHLDTVSACGAVAPVVVDGAWQNAPAGSLGADSRIAVAVLLSLARRAARAGLPLALELLFTVAREQAPSGARGFDTEQLHSRMGFVLDHPTPIGDVIVAAPSHYRLDARFHGAAAPAGTGPERGRSAILAAARAVAAMPQGRLDDQSSVNVGLIAGGTSMSVVPDSCSLVAEARGIDDDRLTSIVSEMVDHLHDAANLSDCECDVDVSLSRLFDGYRVPDRSGALGLAEAALRDCGYSPARVASQGVGDANLLRARGLDVVNLANGTEHAHEATERVSVEALEGLLDVVLSLVHHAAGAR